MTGMKKRTFFRHCKEAGKHGIVETYGYTDGEYFYHRGPDGWTVTDPATGCHMGITKAKSREAAQQAVHEPELAQRIAARRKTPEYRTYVEQFQKLARGTLGGIA